MTKEICAKKICVIIPAYNEDSYIKNTINAVLKLNNIDEIVVIDDGSTDNTWNIISNMKHIKGIRHNKKKGKARSLHDGVKSCDADIYLFIDGDLGDSACKTQVLLDEILNDKCDFCIANIPISKGSGGIGFLRSFSRLSVRIATGIDLPCCLSGQRAIKRSVITDGNIGFYNGFGVEIGMLIDVLNSGYRVRIVNVDLNHRHTHRDVKGFFHRIRQFFDIANVLIIRLMRW
jgi:glycosyltransferase involved in cell wall biosynthesis